MKKTTFIIISQLLLLILSSLISGDAWYVLLNSCLGVLFNFLVCINIPLGFIFGIAYALLNGAIAFHSNIYATAIFMFFIQLPVAIYSYISWNKKSNKKTTTMKTLNKKQFILLMISLVALSILLYFSLNLLNSNNVIVDTFFFVVTVSSCFLLAFYYKFAFVLTLLSGLGGSILWFSQMLSSGNGLSLSVLYIIITVNAIIAIKKQYFNLDNNTNELMLEADI